MLFINDFIEKTLETIEKLNRADIEEMINYLIALREKRGRLFILGVGGSSANASHAVNDFRKLTEIEAYSPTDNVSELTARTNDEGWDSVFYKWLEVSKLTPNDALLILSVGGGNVEKKISMNLVEGADYAKGNRSIILGILGRDGGEIKKISDCSIVIPMLHKELVTPLTEAIQSVLLHLIVSHPRLAKNPTKW